MNPPFSRAMEWVRAHPRTALGIGVVAAAAAAITLYRGVRNWLKPPQVTDQPLAEWVNNTDYDESFPCDVLTGAGGRRG